MKSKKSKNIIEAIDDLMESYGMADYAFYCRAVDGVAFGNWTCGTGDDPMGDRERTDILCTELERLRFSILSYDPTKSLASKKKIKNSDGPR